MSTATSPPSRLRMTAYAAAQLVLAVPALVLFILNAVAGVLAVIVVGIPLLLLTIPATRWLANQHRAMAGRVLGTPIPPQYRPPRSGGAVARLVGWASDPMTWRDQAWSDRELHHGLRARPGRGPAPGACRDRRPLVVRDRADHAGPERDGPLVAQLRTHRDPRAAGPGAHRDARRDPRPLGRRAAPGRARPARRRPGPAGRALDDPRHGRLAVRLATRRRPAGWSARPAPPPAPRSATCARWSAASTRRCSPTAGSPARSQALALDMAIPVDVDRPRWPAGRRTRSSRRSTSRSPSAWPTSASTPAPSTRGSTLAHADGVLRAVVGDDGRGGADPDAGHRHAGGDAAAGGVRRHDEGVEPRRGPDARHPGGPVRLVLAEDHALLRAGLIQLLEGNGFTIAARGRQRRRPRRGAARPGRRRRRGRRTPAADVHRRGPARRDRGPRRAARASRCWCSRSTSSSSTRASCWPAARARSATCSRTGSPTCAEFVDGVRRVAAGGTVLDPEVVATVMARSPDEPRRPPDRRASARCWP